MKKPPEMNIVGWLKLVGFQSKLFEIGGWAGIMVGGSCRFGRKRRLVEISVAGIPRPK